MPPKRPASLSTALKAKKPRKKHISGVPASLTDAYVSCLKTPVSTRTSTMATFLSSARSCRSELSGVVPHLLKVSTGQEVPWSLRVRSVEMMHALCLRSKTCRGALSSSDMCIDLVEAAAEGVGLEDDELVNSGVDAAERLADGVDRMLRDLETQFCVTRFAVAARMLEQRRGQNTSSARAGVILGEGLARVGERVRARRMEVVAEAVRGVDDEVAELDRLVKEANECFDLILPRFELGDERDDVDDDDDEVHWEDGEGGDDEGGNEDEVRRCEPRCIAKS